MSEDTEYRFRVQYAWGRGELSWSYFSTYGKAKELGPSGASRLAYTLLGRPFIKTARFTSIQQKVGSKWKSARNGEI